MVHICIEIFSDLIFGGNCNGNLSGNVVILKFNAGFVVFLFQTYHYAADVFTVSASE